MPRAYPKNDVVPVTEMAIVNTFTKLIFGGEAYTEREQLIIQAFRVMDANVLRDSHQEMGEYLRSLGVREMIQLVSRLRHHLQEGGESKVAAAQALERELVTPVASGAPPGLNRGTH